MIFHQLICCLRLSRQFLSSFNYCNFNISERNVTEWRFLNSLAALLSNAWPDFNIFLVCLLWTWIYYGRNREKIFFLSCYRHPRFLINICWVNWLLIKYVFFCRKTRKTLATCTRMRKTVPRCSLEDIPNMENLLW